MFVKLIRKMNVKDLNLYMCELICGGDFIIILFDSNLFDIFFLNRENLEVFVIFVFIL